MPENFKFTAFISYSHADKKAVRWLHRALEGYRIPKNLVGRKTPYGKVPAKFKPFFRDRDDLSAATNLTASVKKALRQSKFLVVVCSPDAAKSRWVNKEIREFEKLRGREYILCLIVGNKTGTAPGVKASDCFPENILKMKAQGDYEPIAADCRPEGDGKRLAKLKLVSGLLGVELDQLVQRDAQRRQRRQMVGLAFSLLGVFVLSVLLGFAIEARKEAEANRIKAEERQFQAENLVSFMLGDLKTKLEPIGSLQVMDDIAMQALGYYSAMDVSELDPESLSRRSEVLLMMGEIEQKRGNLNLAREIYGQAFLTTEELLSQSPDNPDRIFDHSQSVFWLAYIEFLEGNLEKAEEGFRSYTNYSARLAEIDPDNMDYQIEVGYAYSNIGTLLYRQGKYSEAEKEFQSQLEIFQKLANQNPGSEDLHYEVAQSKGWLANAQKDVGKLQKAKTQRTEELEIYQKILKQNPQNMNVQRDVLVVDFSLGVINSYLGERSAAISYFKKGFETGTVLLAYDPENARIKEYFSRLVITYLEIWNPGKKQDEIGNFSEQAKDLVELLFEKDRANTDWALLYGQMLLVEARNLFQDRKVEEGLEKAQQANDMLEGLWQENQNNSGILTLMGQAALTLAKGYSYKDQPDAGLPVLMGYIDAARQKEKNLSVRGQDFLARALWKAGFKDKARQKRDFLAEMGYNPPDFQIFWETSGS